jgi:hypothetical protein
MTEELASVFTLEPGDILTTGSWFSRGLPEPWPVRDGVVTTR